MDVLGEEKGAFISYFLLYLPTCDFNLISALKFEKYVDCTNHIGIKRHSTIYTSWEQRWCLIQLFLPLLDWIIVNEINLIKLNGSLEHNVEN